MRRHLIVITAITLALAAASPPAATAQASAPALDATNNILYGHTNDDDSDLWMNTLMVDPDATEGATVGMGLPVGESITFTARPTLAAPVTLDPTQSISFVLRFGSGCCVAAGTLSTQLAIGGTIIASAEGSTDTWAGYKETLLTAAPTMETIDPTAGDLTWTVTFEGAGSAFLQVGQREQYSHIVLPILDPPQDEVLPLDDETAGLDDANGTTNATLDGNSTGNATGNTTGNSTTNGTHGSLSDGSNGGNESAAAQKQDQDGSMLASGYLPMSSGLLVLLLAAAAVGLVGRWRK